MEIKIKLNKNSRDIVTNKYKNINSKIQTTALQSQAVFNLHHLNLFKLFKFQS